MALAYATGDGNRVGPAVGATLGKTVMVGAVDGSILSDDADVGWKEGCNDILGLADGMEL